MATSYLFIPLFPKEGLGEIRGGVGYLENIIPPSRLAPESQQSAWSEL